MATLSEVLDFLEEKDDLDWELVEYVDKKNDTDIETMTTWNDTRDFLSITIKPGLLNWKVSLNTPKGIERFKVGILNNDRMNRLESIYEEARSSVPSEGSIDLSRYT